MSVARSSWLAISSSYQRRRIAARSLAVSAAQAGKARAAASMARRVSATPMFGTVPRLSPLAGLTTASVAPSLASTQLPPMKARVRSRSGSRSFICVRSGVGIRVVSRGAPGVRGAAQVAGEEFERARARQGGGLRLVTAALLAVEAVAGTRVHVQRRLGVGGTHPLDVGRRDALVVGAEVIHHRTLRPLLEAGGNLAVIDHRARHRQP